MTPTLASPYSQSFLLIRRGRTYGVDDVANGTISAPAFSSRRIPAPADSRVAPASTRLPTRERASANFPAFDTDWDVPAFQRKGQ